MKRIALFLALFVLAVGAAEKPNLIIIFTDDQGYQDLGCFGSPLIKTPSIDQMAREGVRFADFYVSCNVCTPSRLSLLTGAYPHRMGWKRGVQMPLRDNYSSIKPEFKTIAEIAKDAGYATACIGKWHLGQYADALPIAHGFDSYYGIPYSNDMSGWTNMPFADDALFREGRTRKKPDYTVWNYVPLMHNKKVVEFPVDQATLTKRYTEQAQSFIRENKSQPFFLYLAHSMPHIPLYASPDFKGKSARGLYGDVIEEIDWSVGQIFQTLETLGLTENTWVVYTSDNGPWLDYKEAGGCALPLREGKMTTFEGGHRVPTVMRWPARMPAGKVCREIATTMDLLPTFAALSGGALPDYEIDGHDISILLKDPESATPTDALFYISKFGKVDAVRCGSWKLRGGALYNLLDDIGETTDLAAAHPEIVEKLQARLNRFAVETSVPVGP